MTARAPITGSLLLEHVADVLDRIVGIAGSVARYKSPSMISGRMESNAFSYAVS